MTVAAYVRLSTLEQNLERQFDAIAEYADRELDTALGDLEHYRDNTDDTDIVTVGGLLNAIDDWRSDKIGVNLLLDVIDAWRSGDPVT